MSRFAMCLIGVCCLVALSCGAVPRAKFIDLSWSDPSIEFLEEHLSEMEKDTPLDGLAIRFAGSKVTRNGKTYRPSYINPWSRNAWAYEDMADFIRRYKALKFQKFTDNFLMMDTTVVEMDWFSDSDWAAVAGNFAIGARVAKECGMKGLFFDIEEYGKPFWDISDFPEGSHTAQEFYDMAYNRGRQWGEAVFGAWPEIRIFMTFCLCYPHGELDKWFMNGVLDVMPPTAVIYEGQENAGYSAKLPETYAQMQAWTLHQIRKHVRPELRQKARAQIVLAPAFYLDPIFIPDPASSWHTRLLPQLADLGCKGFLRTQLMAAVAEADPYIWLYGEKRAWWHGFKHPRAQGRWQDAPGADNLVAMLQMIKDPLSVKPDMAVNIVPGGDFKSKPGAWGCWQAEQEVKKPCPGKGYVKDGRGIMKNMSHGCLNQIIPVKGGSIYLFTCKGGFADGGIRGKAGASLCFMDGKRWLPAMMNVSMALENKPGEQTLTTFVQVPSVATAMSVQCYANGQKDTGEVYFTLMHLQELK